MKADVRCMPYTSASVDDYYTEKWLSWNPSTWFIYSMVVVFKITQMIFPGQGRIHVEEAVFYDQITPLTPAFPLQVAMNCFTGWERLTKRHCHEHEHSVILLSTAESRDTFGGGEHLPTCFSDPKFWKWKSLQKQCYGLWSLFLLDYSWSYIVPLDSIKLLTAEATCFPVRCDVSFLMSS